MIEFGVPSLDRLSRRQSAAGGGGDAWTGLIADAGSGSCGRDSGSDGGGDGAGTLIGECTGVPMSGDTPPTFPRPLRASPFPPRCASTALGGTPHTTTVTPPPACPRCSAAVRSAYGGSAAADGVEVVDDGGDDAVGVHGRADRFAPVGVHGRAEGFVPVGVHARAEGFSPGCGGVLGCRYSVGLAGDRAGASGLPGGRLMGGAPCGGGGAAAGLRSARPPAWSTLCTNGVW